jgi:hypothetical protein
MEFFHLAKLLSHYLDGFAEPTRSYLYQAFYLFGTLCILFVIWRLARSEKVSVNGKVITVWHWPNTWYARFKAIKEKNLLNVPPGIIKLTEKIRHVTDWIYAVGLCIVGLVFLSFGLIAWFGNSGWMSAMGMIGILIFAIGAFKIKDLLKK